MKILFITHDTSRTGAPVVLLHLLKWINKDKPNIKAYILALKGGILEDEFKYNSIDFKNYKELCKPKRLSLLKRLEIRVGIAKRPNNLRMTLNEIVKPEFDLIYSNTVLSLPLAAKLKELIPKAKLLLHVHELEVIIKQTVPNFKSLLPSVDHFIVPSELARRNIIERYKIIPAIVSLVYEFSDIKDYDYSQSSIRDKFIVGSCGTTHWRKGTYIFLLVAKYIKKNYPQYNIHFIWVGNLPKSERFIIEEDLRKLELNDIVTFTGELSSPHKVFEKFDVFALCSREDPFPLVAIEAGRMGKPIISFDKATGINEIIKDKGGFIVPYLDIAEMAKKIVLYYDNKDVLEHHGQYNGKKFLEFTPKVGCLQIVEIINTLV